MKLPEKKSNTQFSNQKKGWTLTRKKKKGGAWEARD